MVPTAQWLRRLGRQMQEVWGSNPTHPGLRANAFQVSGGMRSNQGPPAWPAGGQRGGHRRPVGCLPAPGFSSPLSWFRPLTHVSPWIEQALKKWALKRECPVSLPKIRRQRVFQAFSVPGAERLQKLLSIGPWGYILSKNCSKSNDNPEGEKHRKKPRVLVLSRG